MGIVRWLLAGLLLVGSLVVVVGPVFAQTGGEPMDTYTIAPRKHMWKGAVVTDPMAVCQAEAEAASTPTHPRTPSRSAYTCVPNEPPISNSYTWIIQHCSVHPTTKLPDVCGSTVDIVPTRYCQDGSTPVKGPIAGHPEAQKSYEYYCKSNVPPPCSDTNPWIVRVNYGGAGPYSAPTNWDGCKVNAEEMLVCRKYANTGNTYCMWQVRRTGERYTGGQTPNHPPPVAQPDTPSDPKTQSPKLTTPDGKCPVGTVQGGVDGSGVPICIGVGNTPNAPPVPPKVETLPPVTVTNPDGSTTTTTTTKTTNPDGSVTTKTETSTTKPDGSVTKDTTMSTGNTPAGTQGQPSDPNDQLDLCKRNPMLTICRGSSVSGTCGEITCEGDAIQCATLRAAAKMQCQQQADIDELKASGLKTLGEGIVSGADPAQAALDAFKAGTEVDLSAPTLDQGGFVSGSCLAPKTFSVMGRSVTVSFASVCEGIQPLRYAVLACAAILSYLIVARSVLGS